MEDDAAVVVACTIEEQPFHPGRFLLMVDGISLDHISYPSVEAAKQALRDALTAFYAPGNNSPAA